MRLSIFFFMTCVSFFLNCSHAQETTEADKISSSIKKYLDQASEDGFQGSILVDYHGQKIISEGYGFSDIKNRTSTTPETVFDIGSVTKQFTAAAILKLQMQGHLSVTDKITKYFDQVPANRQDVTIHHLLTHTAGFPGGIGNDYAAISTEEFLIDAFNSKHTDPIEFTYNYSNVGYSLLAIIIEKVSGMSYESFLKKYLFEPAGMNYTGYILPEWSDKNIAIGYQGIDRPWGRPNEKNWSTDGPYLHLKGNGGILSTVEDMYLWHRALLKHDILNEAAKKMFYTKHTEEGEGSGSYYGYGWAIFPTPRNTELIAHNGGNGIFFADFWRYLDEQVTIIILTNQANRLSERMASNLARLVRNPDDEIESAEKKIIDVPKEKVETFAQSIFQTLAYGNQDDWESLLNNQCSESFRTIAPMERHFKIMGKFQEKYKDGTIEKIDIQGDEIFLNLKNRETQGELRIEYDLNDSRELIITGLGIGG